MMMMTATKATAAAATTTTVMTPTITSAAATTKQLTSNLPASVLKITRVSKHAMNAVLVRTCEHAENEACLINA